MSFTLSTHSTLRSSLLSAPRQTRSVIHNARPPRRISHPPPLEPRILTPSAGTSRPNVRTQPSVPEGVVLSAQGEQENLARDGQEGKVMTFHYAPPPSAPSYANGAIPDILAWTMSSSSSSSSTTTQVRASSQHSHAPFRNPRYAPIASTSTEASTGLASTLGGEVIREMRALRLEDPRKWTRAALGKKYNIPPTLLSQIPRLLLPASSTAPASSSSTSQLLPSPTPRSTRSLTAPHSHIERQEKSLNARKEGWGFAKRVGREGREIRKGMW